MNNQPRFSVHTFELGVENVVFRCNEIGQAAAMAESRFMKTGAHRVIVKDKLTGKIAIDDTKPKHIFECEWMRRVA